MKKNPTKSVYLLVCFLFAVLTTAVTADAEKENNGEENKKSAAKETTPPSIKLASEKLSVKIGGRVLGDWMWGSAEDSTEAEFGPLVSGNEWRAAWLEVSGNYDGKIDFRVWYDFASGEAKAKDVWLGFKGLPFGSLKVGHFKEPFSLEQLMSLKVLTFMERSLANMFVPSRNTGIGVFGSEGMITWGAGVFTDADSQANAKAHDDTYNATARVTVTPYKEGSTVFHLGAAFHLRSVKDGGKIRFRERPEAHLAYRMVDTGSFAADSVNMFGLEGLVMMDRFSIQSEYIFTNVDAPDLDDPSFNGFYVYGSYFLTDDKRGYKASSSTPGGVKPKNPFYVENGTGAWEVAARYSQLDLDDDLIEGGTLKDITVGINWYLNNYSRFMWNYIYADRDDIGTANIFQMRYQFSF